MKMQPDVIIECTGYQRFSIPFEIAGLEGDVFTMAAESQGSQSFDPTKLLRRIALPEDGSIGFIGIGIRPCFGAIPPIAEVQAMWWTQHLLGRTPQARRLLRAQNGNDGAGLQPQPSATQTERDEDSLYECPQFKAAVSHMQYLTILSEDLWRQLTL